MTEWIDAYPYLFAVLLGLPPVLVGFAVAPAQRKLMLISGSVLALFSPLSVLHDQVYWSPSRLGGGPWGIEDVLCCFSVGSLLWLFAIWPHRRTATAEIRLPVFARRIATFGVVAVGPIFFLGRFLPGIMMATIATQVWLTLALLLVQPNIWKTVMNSSIFYSIYYFIILYLAGGLSSTFYAMWNGAEILGPKFMNLPIEELLWVTSLGCVPLIIAYAAEVKIPSANVVIARARTCEESRA